MSDSWKHVQPLLKFINANMSYFYFLFYLTLGYLTISAIDPANLDIAAKVLRAFADESLPEPYQTGFMTGILFMIGSLFVARAFYPIFFEGFDSIRFFVRRLFGWSSQEINMLKQFDLIQDDVFELYWLMPCRKDPHKLEIALMDLRIDIDNLLIDYKQYISGGSDDA